jgi:hypothetical protein
MSKNMLKEALDLCDDDKYFQSKKRNKKMRNILIIFVSFRE